MNRPSRAPLTGAAFGVALLVVLVQLYLFETVLGAVLDGRREILPGALAVSALLTVFVLFLAFRAPKFDRK